MKKRLITWGIIIVTIFAIIWLAKDTKIEEVKNEVAESFQSNLVEIGIEEVGQPIEGFDAYMLLQAFPGLFEADFDGVRSLEGIYEFKDGELIYKRTAGQPVTSAEKTISDEGYEKLLENVAERLEMKIDGDKSAKELVEELLKIEEAKGGLFLDGSFITNFVECMNAGNPIMESYPRQCRSKNGNLFVEEI